MSGPVQSNSFAAGSSGNTVQVAFLNPVTPGNLLVAYIGTNSVNPTSYTVNDTVNGGNYSQAIALISGNAEFCLAYLPNTASGTPTVTCTFGNSSPTGQIIVEEWAGIITASPLDQAPAGVNGSSTTPTSTTTGTLAQANELVLGVAATGSQNRTYTQGSGFTLGTQIPAGASNGKLCSEWQIVTINTALAATFTLGSSGSWSAGIATFKQIAVGIPLAWTTA